jgi:hypothetical protein
VNPSWINTSHYFEARPDRTLVSSLVILNGYDPKISSLFFNMSVLETQTIKLTQEEYDEIIALANAAIGYGNIDIGDRLIFDGTYCELYYRGVSQRIYCANEDYENLYILLLRVTDLAPPETSIDLRTRMHKIEQFE